MQMDLNALSMRYGKVDDGPYWCKLTCVNDEIVNKNGFQGNDTYEYSIETESAKDFIDEAMKCVPGPVKVGFTIVSQKGEAKQKLTSIKPNQGNSALGTPKS